MAYFLMRCLHKPGVDAKRDAVRPDHKTWVGGGGEGRVSVLIGSAICDEAAKPIGNFGILEAAGIEDAQAFAEGDPFFRAGIVESIELTPLAAGFQAHRIAEPMSPRLALAD